MTALWIIVLCGALAIVYAVWATQSVMEADAGNARMQEIAAAVQEGAQAYLQAAIHHHRHRRRRDLR